MNSKYNENLGQFMITFGICGMIAGSGMMVFGNWEGIFGLISGAFVSFHGLNQIKESKNI